MFSSPPDGVVIVDPEALQGRKGESDSVLAFLGKQESTQRENVRSKTDTLVFCPLVFVTLSCTFRYGRDDMDVMGIAFRRELYLSTRQVYPPLQDRDRSIHTRIQAKLLRKLGDNAFPFFFEVRRFYWQAAEASSPKFLPSVATCRFTLKLCNFTSPVSQQPALLSGSAASTARCWQGEKVVAA